MSDAELVLAPGRASDDDDWIPQVSIVHHGTRELHVIVGEEAEGMAEGVTAEAFAQIEQRVRRLEALERLVEKIDGDGSLVLRCDDGEWSLMAVFGREAEDSPMAAGAIHGIGDTLDECLLGAR